MYLCTTAEREYAWEAWRLLDPHASLFPLQQLEWRMLCVQHPQKKDLLNVLRKQDIDAAASHRSVARCPSDPQYVTDKGRAWGCKVWGSMHLLTCPVLQVDGAVLWQGVSDSKGCALCLLHQ